MKLRLVKPGENPTRKRAARHKSRESLGEIRSWIPEPENKSDSPVSTTIFLILVLAFGTMIGLAAGYTVRETHNATEEDDK